MSTLNGLELAAHTLFGMYNPIDRLVCPSRFMVEKMTAAHVFPTRLRWIPNFVDASTVEAKRAPGGGVVYAGRLSEEKGVETLVGAAPEVEARIDVVGDGPDRAGLENLAERLGAPNISFHGHVSRDAVHQLIRAPPSRSCRPVATRTRRWGSSRRSHAGFPWSGPHTEGSPS